MVMKVHAAPLIALLLVACGTSNQTVCPAPAKQADTIDRWTSDATPLCDGKNEQACHATARTLFWRERDAVTMQFLASSLSRRCSAGDVDSCERLVHAKFTHTPAMNGDSRSANFMKLLHKLCEDSKSRHCTMLIQAYAHGHGTARDPDRAFALAKKHCVTKTTPSCVALADLYMEGIGTPRQPAAAARIYKPLCQNGEEDACRKLAFVYESHHGMHARALRLYRKSCDRGAHESCRSVANLILHGKGTPRDVPKALRIYQALCARDDAASCLVLGEFHERGAHLKQSPELATVYYARACNVRHNPMACEAFYRHTVLKHARTDVTYLYVARAMAEKFCNLQAPLSCHVLGLFHFEGLTVPANPKRARALFKKACQLGYEPGCKSLATTPTP